MDITRKSLCTRRRSRRRFGRRRAGMVLRPAALFTGLLLLAALMSNHLHPILDAYGKSQAQWLSAEIINEAVAQVLTDEELSYSDLVSVSRDGAGRVTAVEADAAKINRLKAEVTHRVLEKLQEHKILYMKAPLGSLFGGEWFSGWGPNIPLRVSVSGSASSVIHSAFSGAGINQTSHQLTLDVAARIVLTFAGYTTAVELENNFLVAETVLVGTVPDSYTEVDGSQTDLLGKIMAYGGTSG